MRMRTRQPHSGGSGTLLGAGLLSDPWTGWGRSGLKPRHPETREKGKMCLVKQKEVLIWRGLGQDNKETQKVRKTCAEGSSESEPDLSFFTPPPPQNSCIKLIRFPFHELALQSPSQLRIHNDLATPNVQKAKTSPNTPGLGAQKDLHKTWHRQTLGPCGHVLRSNSDIPLSDAKIAAGKIPNKPNK